MSFVSFSKEDVGFSPALATRPAPHFSSASEFTCLQHSCLDITQHLGQFNRKPDLFTQFSLPCSTCSSPGFLCSSRVSPLLLPVHPNGSSVPR